MVRRVGCRELIVLEFVRMFLVLGHLGALMAAAIAVAFGDYALLGQRKIQGDLLHRASTAVAWALVALWVTGLGIIYVDTAFDLAAILAKPKILAKLTVVVVLTVNGVIMHARVLPALMRVYGRAQSGVVARYATVAGAVSAACWAYGVFLGVAKPLAPILQYSGFMALFAAVVLGAIAVSAQVVKPELTRRLTQSGWNGQEPDRTPARSVAPDEDADPAVAA
jgi:hypothetical protein